MANYEVVRGGHTYLSCQ